MSCLASQVWICLEVQTRPRVHVWFSTWLLLVLSLKTEQHLLRPCQSALVSSPLVGHTWNRSCCMLPPINGSHQKQTACQNPVKHQLSLCLLPPNMKHRAYILISHTNRTRMKNITSCWNKTERSCSRSSWKSGWTATALVQGHEIECCLTIYAASVCLRVDLAALASILQSVYSVAALLPATLFSTVNATK